MFSSPTKSRDRWLPNTPSRKSLDKNPAWPGHRYRIAWYLQSRRDTANTWPESATPGAETTAGASAHPRWGSLTVEPGNSDDLQQDHGDHCRPCGVLLKQLHHKRSSLGQQPEPDGKKKGNNKNTMQFSFQWKKMVRN